MLFLIYYQNDNNILRFLKNEIDMEKLIFFHSPNLRVQGLERNSLNITKYITDFYHKVTESKAKHSMKRLLDLSLHLFSLTTIKNDEYFIGLKRIFDINKKININYILRIFNTNETQFVDFINGQTEILEESYLKFYMLEISEKKLAENIINNIKELFETMNLSDYEIIYQKNSSNNYDSDRSELQENSKNNNYIKVTEVTEKSKEFTKKKMFQLLINKSFYIFTLLKSIKILNFSKNNDNVNQKLFEEVLKILNFFCDDNPDNCMVVIMSDVVNLFNYLNHDQLINLIEHFSKCFKVLVKNSYYLSSYYNIFSFLKKLIEYSKVSRYYLF